MRRNFSPSISSKIACAAEDIESARDFYEGQEPGVGEYCVDSLLIDIGVSLISAAFIRCTSNFTECWRAVFHLVSIIESMAKKRRFLPCSICGAIQIGFVKSL